MRGNGNSSGPVAHRSWLLREAEQHTGRAPDRFGPQH